MPKILDPPFWRPRVPLIQGDPVSQQEHSVSIHITNERDTVTTFYLEPWGEIYPMPAHAVFVVEGFGPKPGTFEVWHENGAITVWAWPGAWVRVFDSKTELGRPISQP